MKVYISFFAILVFAASVSAQFDNDRPSPSEVYNEDSSRLIKLSGLMNDLGNDKKSFTGKITRLQWHYDDDIVYFDIGKTTYSLDFSNVSNAGRSHLKDILKKNNQVNINAYAGGSNGVWLVREISRK